MYETQSEFLKEEYPWIYNDLAENYSLDLKSGLLYRINEETVVDTVDVEITIS